MQPHVKHLYQRAGFGLSPEEWEQRQNWKTEKAIHELFSQAKRVQPIAVSDLVNEQTDRMNQSDFAKRLQEERKQVALLNLDWIGRMYTPQAPALLERMAFFWHGHFACETKVGRWASLQLNTLRTHALGNFRELVLAIAQDGSMIRYLNNQQNRKDKPNENFARELMELFTIGRGNYTEQDVKEAARAFTGWSSLPNGKYQFLPRFHDYDSKTFLGKTGAFNGEDIIDILLEQKQTAVFIATKVYKHFVNDTPHTGHVQELADVFFSTDYDIEKMMRYLFKADWFYAPQNRGTKIKSPVEFIASLFRTLQPNMDNQLPLMFIQQNLGQRLFDPPNVAGWPGGRTWIDNASLLLRLNFAGVILNNEEINTRLRKDLEGSEISRRLGDFKATVDISPLQSIAGNGSVESKFQRLCDYLLHTPLKHAPTDLTANLPLQASDEDITKALALRILSLPEYQMA